MATASYSERILDSFVMRNKETGKLLITVDGLVFAGGLREHALWMCVECVYKGVVSDPRDYEVIALPWDTIYSYEEEHSVGRESAFAEKNPFEENIYEGNSVMEQWLLLGASAAEARDNARNRFRARAWDEEAIMAEESRVIADGGQYGIYNKDAGHYLFTEDGLAAAGPTREDALWMLIESVHKGMVDNPWNCTVVALPWSTSEARENIYCAQEEENEYQHYLAVTRLAGQNS